MWNERPVFPSTATEVQIAELRHLTQRQMQPVATHVVANPVRFPQQAGGRPSRLRMEPVLGVRIGRLAPNTERLEEFLECKLRCGYARQPAQQNGQQVDGAIIVEVERPWRMCDWPTQQDPERIVAVDHPLEVERLLGEPVPAKP